MGINIQVFNYFHSIMDYPIHIDTICMDLSILYCKVYQSKILENDAFFVHGDCFYLIK